MLTGGRKKGKANMETKKKLEALERLGLAEKSEHANPLWRMGQAAFPGKGETKGETFHLVSPADLLPAE